MPYGDLTGSREGRGAAGWVTRGAGYYKTDYYGFNAKFSGQCAKCKRPIRVRQRICKVDGVYRHVTC